ncbi:alcohol dehydrogenase catalytic domain-containing protein [Propioniciclava sp.]|uniref:alcohol dehydrogenase catalytic domain-containing protein n=1 Tax=Propioniciclava sp. TaxID=2038686 RepID=UPI0026124B10|nr:alcohol dehydrogenase catalytic domain-containing protein [Propioniciclava sp.]
MRALTYDSFRGPMVVSQVPEPSAPPGGVVVAVEATGLCRSDWHGWMGHDADIVGFPHVPGHEFAGRIAELGDGVTGFAVGDRVTAPFVQACGACPTCAEGNGQVCPHQRQPGFTDRGSFAEKVVVRAAATNLVRLPDAVGMREAAALGCRVATAFRGVVHRGRIRKDEWLAVFGCGGVGLAAVMIGVAAGARVIAVDVSRASLSRARALGAEQVRLLEDAGRIQALTDGGVHVSVDAVGTPDAVAAALASLRPRGRHVQIGLLADPAPPVPLGVVISHELDVLGSHGMAASDYAELLGWVGHGRLDLGALLAPRASLSLDEAGAALAGMGEAASDGVLVIDPRN